MAQIFQNANSSRRTRIKWLSRFLIFLLPLSILVVVVAYSYLYNPPVPHLGQEMKKALTADSSAFYRESPLSKKYKGFRKFIDAHWNPARGNNNRFRPKMAPSMFNDSTGIRAAYYVSWDVQSLSSLRRNTSKINLLIPEWFFLDPNTDTLQVVIDQKALSLMHAAGVKITPLLTNNVDDTFRGDIVHSILHDPAKKARLIHDIESALDRYHFNGINIDFEELKESTDETLVSFQKELYTQLHAKGYLVTQNVSAFNSDYDYAGLSRYNDYIFLMAYDEHMSESAPGPVSSQKWIEAAVDDMVKKQVPPQKIVLGIAGYGYDWSKGKASDITYQEALVNARDNQSKVVYDNDTYNLSYSYADDNNAPHQVYFTDAATNFNTLRFAAESNLAGTALWRLGSEDSRLWDFYNKPMGKKDLQSFNFKQLEKISGSNDVDYIGEGEILDVRSRPQQGHIRTELDTTDFLISEETYDSLPSVFVVKKWGKPLTKKMVLTFDDGPDPDYTPQILDTLARYHVPAAFFVVGLQAEDHIPIVKRIYREGHEIGNHTFTHPNMADVSTRRAFMEMDATRLLIECITGHSTVMFRAPFNADSEPESMQELIPVSLSRSRNYLTIGESIDPEDWEAGSIKGFNADTVFNRVVRYAGNGNIILLHDAGGDRSATVKALPRIIRYFRSQGYTFTTVADLLGKKRDDMMPPVPKGSGYYILQTNYLVAEMGFYLQHIFYTLFISFLILGTIRLLIMAFLAIRQKRKEKREVFGQNQDHPFVSIIVPAFNEEVNAVNSVHNLLACDYPNFNIIFIDDGSSDKTFENVSAAFGEHKNVSVFKKPNGGKASALNFGISKTTAEYVVCIDADTKLQPDAVARMMRHFSAGNNVGAVAGVVKVGNEVNMLTKWQSIEYITSQNFDRKAFANINAITVIPGAIGAFKKEALIKAGGFTTDTLAEDCDLTIHILEAGYLIKNEPTAIALTEAPETVREFMKQRFRWTYGILQTVWKHKHKIFSFSHPGLGWIALPDMIVFKYFIPLFTPLADLVMLIGLMTSGRGKIFMYYLVFMVVDALVAYLAFVFQKEKPWKLVWLIPQRLIYRWLMLIVLLKSYRKAILGELQNWGVLKRTGNVKTSFSKTAAG